MRYAILNINWWAVILATVAYYFLGGLWFLQSVFGKYNDDALGFDRPEKWKPGIIYFTVPLFTCFLTSAGVSIILFVIKPVSVSETILLGLIIGICFAFSVSLVNAVTPKISKPVKYGIIIGAYHTIGIITISLIYYSLT